MYKNKCIKCGFAVILLTILAATFSVAAARGPLTEMVMQSSLYASFVGAGINEKNKIIAEKMEKERSRQEAAEKEKRRLAEEAKIKAEKEELERKRSFFKPGKIVKMGSYPQGPDGEVRPIEWIVLEVEEDKVLLISKYSLDAKQFNKERRSVSWQECTLRKWLNNDFYNSAFNAEEASVIAETYVKAEENPVYTTYQGNDTRDKVFLLNIQEAYNYFKNDEARKCYPTDYAVKQGAYKDDNGGCWWWLRSSGHDTSYHAAYVDLDGGLDWYGDNVNYVNLAVRPALWINL